jgi:spore coat protein CotF
MEVTNYSVTPVQISEMTIPQIMLYFQNSFDSTIIHGAEVYAMMRKKKAEQNG